MIDASGPPLPQPSLPHGRRGFALVVVLPLLALIAIVSLAVFAAAVVDQRMVANVEQRERAFQAAEFAVALAMQAPGLGTDLSFAAPRIEPAAGGVQGIAGSSTDGYSYRLYFDRALVPADAADAAAADVREFHFVVEATGHAGRGARAVHVQGFRLLRPAGWTADPVVDDCAPGDAGCPAAPPYPGPERTYWLQADAE